MRTRSLLSLVCVVAVVGCNRPKPDEVKKDKPAPPREIAEVELPEGALASLAMRDPDQFAKKVGTGAGVADQLGDSPFQKLLEVINDDDLRKMLRALDPHGTISGLALQGTSLTEPHGAIAAVVKDPDVAKAALLAYSKSSGGFKTWNSKILTGPAYEGYGTELTVQDRVIIMADSREALEKAAPYLAWRSGYSKLAHDITVHVPVAKMGPQLEALGNEYWQKTKSDLPPKSSAEIDHLVPPILSSLTSMGTFELVVDAVGSELRFQEKLPFQGKLSAWAATTPSGSAAALLKLPRGDASGVWWMPPGLGPLAIAAGQEAFEIGSTLSAPEKAEAGKHISTIVNALGNEVGYTQLRATGTPLGPVNLEIMTRIELRDPAAVNGALAPLRKLVEKAVGRYGATPYKKFGAEGETFSTKGAVAAPGFGKPAVDNWFWAVQGDRLFVDVCLGCKPALIDNALDPASVERWDHDEGAKAKVAECPKERLTSAFYGAPRDAAKLMVTSTASVPMWSWATMDANGASAQGALPIATLATLAQAVPGLMLGGPPPY